MSKRSWLIGGAVSLVVLLAVVLLMLNRDDGSPLANESTTSTTENVTTTTAPETTTTIAETTTTGPTSTTTPTNGSSTSSVPITSPPGTLPPDPDPNVGKTEDDPVPYQTSVRLDQWQIGVSLANLDATQLVLDFVPFNDPPAEGSVYVLVELSGVYRGSSIAQPVFDWKLKAPDLDHTPDGLECGVIPESLYDVGDIPSGGSFKANVCFEVPEEFIGDDLLLSLGLFDESGRLRYFSLS